jgi:hypothetical protein
VLGATVIPKCWARGELITETGVLLVTHRGICMEGTIPESVWERWMRCQVFEGLGVGHLLHFGGVACLATSLFQRSVHQRSTS